MVPSALPAFSAPTQVSSLPSFAASSGETCAKALPDRPTLTASAATNITLVFFIYCFLYKPGLLGSLHSCVSSAENIVRKDYPVTDRPNIHEARP
ncbi:hypothetical protein D9M73_247070 [compost metagenome]